MLRLLLVATLFFVQIAQAQDHKAAQTYFQSSLKDWDVADLGNLEITKEFIDEHNKVHHIYGVQTFEKLPVHPAYFDLHFVNNQCIAAHQSFVKLSKTGTIKGSLSAEQVLETALQYANGMSKKGFGTTYPLVWKDKYSFSFTDKTHSDEAITGKKVWFVRDNQLIETWQISILTKDKKHWWNLYIATEKGQIIETIDWMVSCNPTDCHVKHNHDMPHIKGEEMLKKLATPNSYKVVALPLESPIYGSLQEVVNPRDSIASPYGWHDVNGVQGAEYTITRGNNVYARDDKDANNTGGYSPNGGADLIFNADFDINKPASDYLDAAIINLFYMNNMMHDVWYKYGFNEVAGNFQQNNYNKGGAANDFVFADAQDGSGTNNANFATPADGTNPRMQMYIWNGGAASSKMVQVNSPAAIKGKYDAVQAGFTPQLNKTPLTANLILVNSLTTGSNGCDSLLNSAALKNNIAFIDRGNCTFVEKIQRAQAAGAIAVIVANNVSSAPISMGGSGTGITIPAIMISLNNANTIKAQLSSTVNVTLYDSSGVGLKVYDSDFDNGVIAHEYGHGISNRLTGGAANSSCLTNQEQMGEGWSDFFALTMTHENGDKGTDLRGIGNYLTGEGVNGSGIRTYPYSTNKSISKYSYNSIKTLSVPHGVGSVWCAMLWDLYWALIDKYGYDDNLIYGTGGNNMAMQLVIDGLKLQPCNPGFVDGRDAILLADRINNKGANQLLIWQVFAGRGLGFSANQGSSGSRSDGVEGFDIPPTLNHTPTLSKWASEEITSGDVLTYKIEIKNNTPNTLYSVNFSDTLSADVQYMSSVGCTFVQSGSSLNLVVDSMQSGDSLICSYDVKLNANKYTIVRSMDSLEGSNDTWNFITELGVNSFKLTQNKKKSGANSFFIANESASSDYSLWHAYNLKGISKPAFIFSHLYNTEDGWDGAVVEIRLKGETLWKDVAGTFIKGGYNNFIAINPASTLSGRPAFTGNSGSFVESIIDLSAYADSEVEIRFRFASDGAAGGEGWYIDDIGILDVHTVTNNASARAKSGGMSASSVRSVVYKGDQTGVSIQNLITNGFLIYPNPTRDQVTIQLNGAKPAQSFGEFVVYNNLGQEVYRQVLADVKTTLNIDNWSKGVYYFAIKLGHQTSIEKIVKY